MRGKPYLCPGKMVGKISHLVRGKELEKNISGEGGASICCCKALTRTSNGLGCGSVTEHLPNVQKAPIQS